MLQRSPRSSGSCTFLLVFCSVKNISYNDLKRILVFASLSKYIFIPLGYSILFQMQLFCPGILLPPHHLQPTFKTCLELLGCFCSSSCCKGHRALLLPEIMSVNLQNDDHIIYYFLVSICVFVDLVRIFFI